MKKLLGAILVVIGLHSSIHTLESQVPEEVAARIVETMKENPWPGLYYDVVAKAIQKHGYQNVVEVGVAFGGNAEYLLRHTSIQKYTGVDPYVPYDPEDGFHQQVSHLSTRGAQYAFDCLFNWVNTIRLAPYGERYQLIRKSSVEAAADFEDGSLDCVFIDGDHRYDAVLQDLRAWFPKVKPGCLILGDDYYMEDVSVAVERFFGEYGTPPFFLLSDEGYKIWAVYK